MFITAEEQIEFFRNYYSFEIIELLNRLKDKNKNFKLLNKCSNKTYVEFVDLIMENIDLKNMYLSHLKS